MAEVKIAADSGGGSVGLVGPASTTSNAALQLKLPTTIGTANQVLRNSSTAGTLEFGTGVINSYSQVVTAASTISNTTSDIIKSPNITPASASSKFIITVSFNWSSDNPNTGLFLYRETSGPTYSNLNPTQSIDGHFGTEDGHVLDIDENHTDNTWTMDTWTQSFVDSPGNTTQLNYTLRGTVAASCTLYINRAESSANYTGVSTMTILELSS